MTPRLALLAVAGLLAATGCGTKEEVTSPTQTQKLRVMLDYLPNPDHVGLFVAQAAGEFRRAGLDVELVTPPDPAAPLKLLAARRVDLAISYEPELLLARDRLVRVVSVAALVQRPLTSIIALGGSPVRTPADLAGRRVGTAGIPYQSAQLRTILRRAGRAPGAAREVDVGFNLVPAMLTGRVDATLGAFWNVEGVQLRRERRKPRIIPVDRAGVPPYDELVIAARQDDLPDQGNAVRRFVAALSRGTDRARRDPEAATRMLVRANRGLKVAEQLPSVRATLPVLLAPRGRPFGYHEAGEWDRFGRWMRENGVLRREPAAADAQTNEFLPGEGL